MWQLYHFQTNRTECSGVHAFLLPYILYCCAKRSKYLTSLELIVRPFIDIVHSTITRNIEIVELLMIFFLPLHVSSLLVSFAQSLSVGLSLITNVFFALNIDNSMRIISEYYSAPM